MAAKLSRHGLTGEDDQLRRRPRRPPPRRVPSWPRARAPRRHGSGAPGTRRGPPHRPPCGSSTTLTTTGPGLRSSQRWTASTTVASAPSGVPRSSTTTSRSASASCAKPTSAPERRTRSPSSARFVLLRLRALPETARRRPRRRPPHRNPGPRAGDVAGSRRRAAAGIHGDSEPPRSDSLDVDRLGHGAKVARGGRRIGANVGHVQGPHPGVEALVIEVGEFGRLVGAKGQSAGSDELERVPLERAMAPAHGNAAERARLAHVEHQRGHGDDPRVDRRTPHAEEARDRRLLQHLAGGPRVGADDDGARAAVGAERGGEARDKLRGERLADDSTHARGPDLQGQGLRHGLSSLRARR